MSNLGMNVMLNMLGGNAKSVAAFTSAIGKTIVNVSLGQDDALHLKFDDGSGIRFYDDGQLCCESRYMTTDDDLSSFIGTKLLGAEIKSAPEVPDQYEDHEVEFLEIQTNAGVFTMASHNEHNGFYGGFSIRVVAE